MGIDFSRPGRMISLSKSTYAIDHPDHICVFNANVCVKSRGKIWHGDIDLMADEDDLKALAAEIGESVYVLREYDARFENEDDPLYDKFVGQFDKDGTVTVQIINRA